MEYKNLTRSKEKLENDLSFLEQDINNSTNKIELKDNLIEQRDNINRDIEGIKNKVDNIQSEKLELLNNLKNSFILFVIDFFDIYDNKCQKV